VIILSINQSKDKLPNLDEPEPKSKIEPLIMRIMLIF